MTHEPDIVRDPFRATGWRFQPPDWQVVRQPQTSTSGVPLSRPNTTYWRPSGTRFTYDGTQEDFGDVDTPR